MGARLELESRALPQEALVRDTTLGLHAGTERGVSKMAHGWLQGWLMEVPGLRSDATDAAAAGLCVRARVVAALPASCS